MVPCELARARHVVVTHEDAKRQAYLLSGSDARPQAAATNDVAELYRTAASPKIFRRLPLAITCNYDSFKPAIKSSRIHPQDISLLLRITLKRSLRVLRSTYSSASPYRKPRLVAPSTPALCTDRREM